MTISNDATIAAWAKIAEDGDFEATYAALEESVALLESGGLSLSLMTDCYEIGLRLSKRCSDLLRAAELRVSVLEQSIAEAEPLSLDFDE